MLGILALCLVGGFVLAVLARYKAVSVILFGFATGILLYVQTRVWILGHNYWDQDWYLFALIALTYCAAWVARKINQPS